VRKYQNGKRAVFYFAYDETDTRVGPWTTKCLTKTAARNFCCKLLKAGLLAQDKRKAITFGEYATDFWERDSEYIKKKEGRRDGTDHYMLRCKKYLQNQIIPFFGDWGIDKITDRDVAAWLLGFREREVKAGEETIIKKYKNSYANSVFNVLRCGQYSEDGIGYKDYTKTRENRAIPLMPEIVDSWMASFCEYRITKAGPVDSAGTEVLPGINPTV
jgi:hypothetical protein